MAAGARCRVPMVEVNPHVLCVLCGGYFIDATTIIECLHSFCRKCIVTYLESSRFCPICDVQVHKTRPLLSIRSDATLQDIVYKLVPGLYRDEMRRRREFYARRPTADLPSERGEPRGEERRAVFAPDELMEVRLQYWSGDDAPASTSTSAATRPTGARHAHQPTTAAEQVRYLRCPAVVTVGHLQHMLSCKHQLPAGRHVQLLARGELLTADLMLLDVAYLHCWRRVGPLQLFYRIVSAPPVKHSNPELTAESTNPVRPTVSTALTECSAIKEKRSVLDHSENGVLPVLHNMTCKDNGTEKVSENNEDEGDTTKSVRVSEVKRTVSEIAPLEAASSEVGGVTAAVSGAGDSIAAKSSVSHRPTITPATIDIDKSVCSGTGTAAAGGTDTVSGGVRAGGTPHKEVQLHISETGEMSFGASTPATSGHVDILQQACKILDSLETEEHTIAVSAAPVGNGQSMPAVDKTKTPTKDSNKNEIKNSPVRVDTKQPKVPPRPGEDTRLKRSPSAKDTPSRLKHGRVHEDNRKRSSPVGYKTLKTPPKSWNPQVPRTYVGSGQKTTSDSVRTTVSPIAPKPPPRFFKMRHHSSASAGGAPAVDVPRPPLLMRVEPGALGAALWPSPADQLLSASPLIYPHLYATQPLPFLPAAGLFAPPPAHSGVGQLTYTSAPGALSPLLTPPTTPQQQRRTATGATTTAAGAAPQTALASAAASAGPPAAPPAPVVTGKQRSHVACSVPSARARASERPLPASTGGSPPRLPLSAFIQQMSPPTLGLAGLPGLGAPLRLNGHAAAGAAASTARRAAFELSPTIADRASKRQRTETAVVAASTHSGFQSAAAAAATRVASASTSLHASACSLQASLSSAPALSFATTVCSVGGFPPPSTPSSASLYGYGLATPPASASISQPVSASAPLSSAISLKIPSTKSSNLQESESRPSPKAAAPPPLQANPSHPATKMSANLPSPATKSSTHPATSIKDTEPPPANAGAKNSANPLLAASKNTVLRS